MGSVESLFDFKEVMAKIGRLFVRGLSLRIREQVGIDGTRYTPPEPSTLRARQRMLAGTMSKKKGVTKGITLKGKTRKVQAVGAEGLSNVPITRLLVSQDTANRGFESEATKNSVRVWVSMKSHMKMGKQPKISYAEIIAYNSRGQSDVNPSIKSPPLVFPTSEEEVNMMKQEMDFARRMFDQEATKQMKEKCRLDLKKTLNVI